MVPRRTLELALDYRCNLRCLGCRACEDRGERLAPGRLRSLLREGLAGGARTLWLGGGEPTLRDDLLAVVRLSRSMGYDNVILQTNGVRLSYPAYAQAVVDAGVTHVRVNVKSAREVVHDALCQVEGAHALLLRALEQLALHPQVPVTADVLLTRATAPHLDETVAFVADRGVRRFALWLLYAGDCGAGVEGEVPRISDLVPALERTAEIARSRGLALSSFHTPPCALPEGLRWLWTPARELAMTVVDPSGAAFPLESSPFEGGGLVAACDGCEERARCGGPRADYLRLHGAAEFRALRSPEG